MLVQGQASVQLLLVQLLLFEEEIQRRLEIQSEQIQRAEGKAQGLVQGLVMVRLCFLHW